MEARFAYVAVAAVALLVPACTNSNRQVAVNDPIDAMQVLEVSGRPIRQTTDAATLTSLPALIEDDAKRPVSQRPQTADCLLAIRVHRTSGATERLCLWFHPEVWDKTQPIP